MSEKICFYVLMSFMFSLPKATAGNSGTLYGNGGDLLGHCMKHGGNVSCYSNSSGDYIAYCFKSNQCYSVQSGGHIGYVRW